MSDAMVGRGSSAARSMERDRLRRSKRGVDDYVDASCAVVCGSAIWLRWPLVCPQLKVAHTAATSAIRAVAVPSR